MRLKQMKILLLLIAGLGFTVNSFGWTLHVHVEACCDHHHEHDHEEEEEEHDADNCAICQSLTTLSKQILVSDTSIYHLHNNRYSSHAYIAEASVCIENLAIAIPRAPPYSA